MDIMVDDMNARPLLPLQKGCIYGPIQSRRLGASLGLNILPVKYKLCSFNCVYCQYGITRTRNLIINSNNGYDFPSVPDLEKALLAALSSLEVKFTYMTFSGNGEPTLHPQFPKMVDAVREIRNKYRPDARIAILSNATKLHQSEIKAALRKIDVPVLKLDAGSEPLFKKINRAAKGVKFDDLVRGLTEFDHPGKIVQALIFNGRSSNNNDENLKAWAKLISQIKPVEAQVYTLDRAPASADISAVSKSELQKFASRASKLSGIKVTAY
jgi:wyosine [tRNA(Phe)-imidazoG37] synthetase (radical SAM superfamily)